MLRALSAGESDATALANLAKGLLRNKHGELVESLEGQMSAQQRWLLDRMLGQVKFLEEEVAVYDKQLAELMRSFEPALTRLDTIDGVGRRTAEVMLAELGPEMSQFPGADHAASWAGMSPGNNESAGKRKSGKTAGGNKWLRRALTEAAYAGSRKKDSYLKAQFWRLSGRRGRKRAAIAVGRTILVAAFHILKEEVVYADLGGDYFDRSNAEKTKRQLVKRLERLGYQVELRQLAAAA